MNDIEPDAPAGPLTKPADELLKLAPRIAGLSLKELLAVTGGFSVIGLAAGGIFWAPFAMALLPLLLEFYLFYTSRHLRKLLDKVQQELVIAKAKIEQLAIPEAP